MKLNRKELHRALVQAVRATSRQRPFVRLQAGSGILTVSTTNLEVTFQTRLHGDCEYTFETKAAVALFDLMVDAKQVRDLVKNLAGDTVDIEALGQDANIGGGLLKGDDPELMPVVRDSISGPTIELAGEEFKRMIGQVKHAVSKEDSRYAINGMLLELGGDKLRLVGTDGRRLAVATAVQVLGQGSIIVPMAAMEMVRLGLTAGNPVDIVFGDQLVRFRFGETEIVVRLLEQTFPDYEQVIPKETSNRVTVERKELEAVVKHLKVHNAELIKFTLLADYLTLSTSGNGEGTVTIAATVKGEGTIGFNPHYVLDILKASDHDEISIRFENDETPSLWDVGFVSVLMPVSVV